VTRKLLGASAARRPHCSRSGGGAVGGNTMRSPKTETVLAGLPGVELVQLDNDRPGSNHPRVGGRVRRSGRRASSTTPAYRDRRPRLEGFTDETDPPPGEHQTSGNDPHDEGRFVPHMRERGSGGPDHQHELDRRAEFAVPFNSMYHATEVGL